MHAAASQSRAFFLSNCNILKNFFHLALANKAPHDGCLFPRHANGNCVESFDGFFNKGVIDIFVDENSGTCTANLALVKEDAKL